MKALLDFDVLVYECGFGVMTGWEEENPPRFDRAAELLDNKIANIVAMAGADSYQGFLTGKNNFREKIAVTKPYKGNRKQEKPFHYKNLRAYMVGKHNAIIIDGMEADDAMAIEQYEDWRNCYKIYMGLSFEEKDISTLGTIICSRDKDLKQCPGMHYSWENGRQPSFGPKYISYEEGMRFFYYQCLVGDTVDHIQGLPKCGPVKAQKILGDTQVSTELFQRVREAYRGFYEDIELADKQLLEMGQLLYMTKELDEEGNPILWEFPKLDEQPF